MPRAHSQVTLWCKVYILTLSFRRVAYKDIPHLYSLKPKASFFFVKGIFVSIVNFNLELFLLGLSIWFV